MQLPRCALPDYASGELSESPTTAVGQVSKDGQFRWDGTQWVPIASGEREPTSWTRPMRLAVAGLFVVEAISGIVFNALFLTHENVLNAIHAQGTSIPSGTDINTLVDVAIATAWTIAIVIALVELTAAVGSYLGWRWIFWVAFVVLALDALQAVTNLGSVSHPSTSPQPGWVIATNEVIGLVALGLFIWMVVGLIKFGPWAMKKPGT